MPGFPVMAAPMMTWVLEEFYKDLFHQVDFVERSFIVPLAMEASLTPLMERIENSFPDVKVFSLPSVGDPQKEGIFAKRHIELGVKGPSTQVESAWPELRQGVQDLGHIIHDLHKNGD